MEPIIFKLGEENRIFVEGNIHTSQLFKEQYLQLCERIDEYTRRTADARIRITRNAHNTEEEELYSNVFVINGERGSGKTSVLASLRKYLLTKEEGGSQYMAPTIVDPSFFSRNANLLQIIIAELFRDFQDYKCKHDIALEEQNKIIKVFGQIKHALVVMENNQNKDWDDDIESLADMSDAVNLRSYIQQLVCEMLKMHHRDLLLISIDDIDLNTEHAYRMLEQLRKYFTLPNVVILMATKMDQLHQVLEKHFVEEFSSMMEKSKMMQYEEIADISSRYLLKIIPLENRVDLNTMAAMLDHPISVVDVDDNEICQASTIELMVLQLIWQKTGYMFLKRQSGFSFAVPRNLRALRFFIKFLVNMPENEDSIPNNRILYQEYFRNEWVESNLSLGNKEKVNTLFNIDDVQMLNKKIVDIISPSPKVQPIPSEIISPLNKVYNVSLGDVMMSIISMQETITDEQQLKFLFAIKSIYTFYLEEAYQKLLTESEINRRTIASIYTSPVQSLSEYQRLVGGAMLNGQYLDVLPNTSGSKMNRMHHEVTLSEGVFTQDITMLTAMVLYGDKSANSGEEYRRRNERYYTRSLLSVRKFIIDWFYLLYSIPFFIEQYSRFAPSTLPSADYESGEIIRKVASKIGVDLSNIIVESNYERIMRVWNKWLCIHSVDVLERIYHTLHDHHFKYNNNDPFDIYRVLLNTMGSIDFDYISDTDMLSKSAPRVYSNILDDIQIDPDYVRQFIEPNSGTTDTDTYVVRPTRAKLSPMKIQTITKMHSVQDVKNSLIRINLKYNFRREWIERRIDDINIPNELFDGTMESANIIYHMINNIRY